MTLSHKAMMFLSFYLLLVAHLSALRRTQVDRFTIVRLNFKSNQINVEK